MKISLINTIIPRKPYVKPLCKEFSSTQILRIEKELKAPISDILQLSKKTQIAEEQINAMLSNIKSADDLIVLGMKIKEYGLNLEKSYIDKYVQAYNEFYINSAKNNPLQAKEIFTKIFDRYKTEEISESKAEEILQRYKSVINEPNDDIFIQRLFNELKKDFGLEYSSRIFKPEQQNDSIFGISGFTSKDLSALSIKYNPQNPLMREKVFSLLFHEMTHAKQAEIMIAIDADEYIHQLADKAVKQVIKKYPELSQEAINKAYNSAITTYSSKLKDEISLIQKKYGIIDKNTQLYHHAKKLLDAENIYFSPTKKGFSIEEYFEYRKQLCESEAYDSQNLAVKLYYLIKEGLI